MQKCRCFSLLFKWNIFVPSPLTLITQQIYSIAEKEHWQTNKHTQSHSTTHTTHWWLGSHLIFVLKLLWDNYFIELISFLVVNVVHFVCSFAFLRMKWANSFRFRRCFIFFLFQLSAKCVRISLWQHQFNSILVGWTHCDVCILDIFHLLYCLISCVCVLMCSFFLVVIFCFDHVSVSSTYNCKVLTPHCRSTVYCFTAHKYNLWFIIIICDTRIQTRNQFEAEHTQTHTHTSYSCWEC